MSRATRPLGAILAPFLAYLLLRRLAIARLEKARESDA